MVRMVVLMAVALSGCGPWLTVEQRAWCATADHVDYDAAVPASVVAKAALELGLAVPDKILQQDAWRQNPAGDGGLRVEGYDDALAQWRGTSEYARACIAAFEQRVVNLSL